MSSVRWYHAPALVAFVVASKIQKDTFRQLQKMRRNKYGMKLIHLVRARRNRITDELQAYLNRELKGITYAK